MPRPRTGQLVLRNGIFHARVTVTRAGRSAREWYTLDTADHATAERRKDKLLAELAAGRMPDAAATVAGAPDTVQSYAAAIGARVSECDRANLRLHVVPAMGSLALDEVKPTHVKAIRNKVIATGARRGSQHKVLGAMRRAVRRSGGR